MVRPGKDAKICQASKLSAAMSTAWKGSTMHMGGKFSPTVYINYQSSHTTISIVYILYTMLILFGLRLRSHSGAHNWLQAQTKRVA